jgi:hypothetical protein
MGGRLMRTAQRDRRPEHGVHPSGRGAGRRYAFELARKTGRSGLHPQPSRTESTSRCRTGTKSSGPGEGIRTSRPISSTSTPLSHGSSPTRSISTSWWEATCSVTSCPTLAPPSREVSGSHPPRT